MNKQTKAYEIVFALLALIAVSLAAADLLNKIPSSYQNLYFIVDKAILALFVIDYFYGLYRAKDKKLYVKSNIFELISIIPLDSFFRAFRLLRFRRIVRVMFLTRRLSKSIPFMKTNGFIYVLIITISTVFIGALAIYSLEGSTIKSFSDALWWSFVTTTTVGYGDLSPQTGAGRIVAVILMLVGISFIGMLTGTIATYFLSRSPDNKDNNPDQILDLTDLDSEKFLLVKEYSEYVKSKKQKI